MYVQRGGPFERFLYFDAEHYWRAGSCEYKDQDKYEMSGYMLRVNSTKTHQPARDPSSILKG